MVLSLDSLLTLGLLLAFVVVFGIAYVRFYRGDHALRLRPLPGVDVLRLLADRSIEEGRALHLALGTGRMTDPSAAQTLMGLIMLDQLAEQSVRTSQIPIVSTSDPVTQILVADQLGQGQIERGWRTRTFSRFVAPEATAYGAGTRGMMQRENLGLTAAIGYLGNEYLFLAAEEPDGGQPMYVPEMAATAHLETLPLIQLTARHPILGEEVFALGAYLGQWPSHIASVLLQDVARALLCLVVVGGVVWNSLRLLGVL